MTKSSFKTLIIGVIVTSLVLILFVGNIMAVMSLYVVLIICTGGVGLVPLAVVFFGAGLIVEKIFLPSKKQQSKSEPLDNQIIALVNYIKQAKTNNISQKQIITLLEEKGWSSDAINKAFKEASRK